MQSASFSTQYFYSLAEGTVRTAIDHVSHTFRSSNRPDRRNDDGWHLSYILYQQYKGYNNQDKKVKQQKPLPLIFLRELHKNKTTVENISISQLSIGAISLPCNHANILALVYLKKDDEPTTYASATFVFMLRYAKPPIHIPDLPSPTQSKSLSSFIRLMNGMIQSRCIVPVAQYSDQYYHGHPLSDMFFTIQALP